MLEVWQNWPLKRDCRSGNKKNNASASGLGKGSKDQSQDQGQNLVHVCNRFIKYSVSLIFEAFYVQVDGIAWWIDSGVTTHVCKDRCWFKTYKPVKDGSVLYMGDDHFTPVHGKGSVVLEFSSGKSITLFNVLYVPKLRKNLISGPVLNKCGYKQVYESDKYILSKCGVFVGFGYYNNGMFMLNLNKVPDDSDSVYMSSSTVVNSSLWHARLGHVHYKRMLEMSKDDLIPAIDENHDKCTTCMLTKITRQPFKSITRKSVILELIHSDLCDFHATPSLGNKKYVITFIDDASRFCYVYLLHAKDEALDKFRIYKTEVELQQNDLVKTLRTDRGGEYYDPVFFQSVGIIHETTAPYTPQQNGVAERKNRALKEMVNSMAVVRLPDPKQKTLGEKGIDCIFVGYPEHSKTYRFYVIEPNDLVSINSIIESRDAIFDENRFSSIPRPKDIIPNSDESQRDDHSDDVPIEGSRDQVGSQYSYCYSIKEDPITYNEAMQSQDSAFRKEAIDDEIGYIMENNTWVLSDLPLVCKPLGCKWIFKRKMKVDGIIFKFKARLVIQGFRQKEGIKYFDTYAPVARITTIRFWIPSVLEAYSDASWINHVEDSSSTSRWVFLLGKGAISWASKKQTCITGSTMASKNWNTSSSSQYAALLDPESDKWLNAMNVEMQSMKDNKVWVLVELPPNGKTVGSKWLFKKETNMDGAVHTYKAHLVAKGYTQTPGIDYKTFSLLSIRAIRIRMPKAEFYDYEIWKWMSKMLLMDISMKRWTWSNTHEGEAAYILGIKIYRDRSRRLIGLCQSAYIEKILKRFHLENSKRGSIPMQDKLRLSKSQGASTPAELKRMQSVPYASAVGSIMYAVRCTRPDVAFAQNITSRFQQNPGDLHWTTVKNILKYLRNTKDMFLVYGGDLKRELRVSCYTDAGYLTDADDLKSQTGYVFVLNGGAVDWKSAKQSIFATSSAEAEYIAAFDASKEAVWVRKFISGLGVVPTIEKPINMYCDNTGAIAIANESGITKGARHFRAKVHYLREVIEFGDIKLEKVHTDDNLADPFTKALAFPKHSELTRNIGMLPASSFM
ncbi:zinc finger, CCHC-type containing protein [Tanacetum coccineum]|uniref:Zinc finger, CCHC-type containing protein n=2 Tax=Tanacetum coccineum TaxID=301880 RepID=A0ABQ4Z8Z7_9ASTR